MAKHGSQHNGPYQSYVSSLITSYYFWENFMNENYLTTGKVRKFVLYSILEDQ
jgi:hypothetical protein